MKTWWDQQWDNVVRGEHQPNWRTMKHYGMTMNVQKPSWAYIGKTVTDHDAIMFLHQYLKWICDELEQTSMK
jgi:hypothetical protein